MTDVEQQIATSVLVIGTGGSGLRAAIELAERGIDVLVVGKRPKTDAHTTLAAGGINAALATMDADDTWQQHAADTLTESYLLADPVTVQVVTEGAAESIRDLERYGMAFAREQDGRISQRFFGAHTFRRTAFAGDYTGLELQRALVEETDSSPSRSSTRFTSPGCSSATRSSSVRTASTFQNGTRYAIHSDAVILATGGHTRIWRRTSSRRDENTGDSFRLALEAGGRIRNPELVQFHPSGLIEPEDSAGTLVSEAARGEGGILRNDLGERFMKRYDPGRMELSTRDRVALAAYTEIKEGRGTPRGGVWLDVSHLPRTQIMDRLPRVYQTLMDLQLLDITTTPIEIAPTAHYSMGGVWVRPEDHRTDVEGLYAIGEASSGLHGANRLGGNSLIELLVYGKIVGHAAARLTRLSSTPNNVAVQRYPLPETRSTRSCPPTVRRTSDSCNELLRNTMTEHAGVVRNEAGLLTGLSELAEIEERLTESAYTLTSPGSTTSPMHLTSKPASSPRGPRSRRHWNVARHAAATIAPTTRFLDEGLNVNMVWSGPGRIEREAISGIPARHCGSDA